MGKYYSLYNDVKLRKGGRKIAKLSEKQFGEKAKKFILDTCKDDSWTTDKMNKTNSTSKIISSLPRAIRTIYYNDKKGETIIKKDFKGIQPDWENYDITSGLRTVKGCPYIVMMVGGDWECPLCVMIYYDGKQFRCYIPEKGNAYRKDTKRLFGNCDASYDSKTETYTDEWKKNGTTYVSDDKYAFNELVKEGILDKEKDKDKLRGLGRNIEFDTKKCIEDFTSRVEPISVKESYHRISSNDIKMIYESITDNEYVDEASSILYKSKNITIFQLNLLNILHNQFNKIKDNIFLSKVYITGYNNITNHNITVNLTKNVGWITGLTIENAVIEIIKDEYTVSHMKVTNDKNGQPTKDFSLTDENNNITQHIQIKCINQKNLDKNTIMNSNIRNNVDIGIILVYSFNKNNIIINQIYVFPSQVDKNGIKNFNYLSGQRKNKNNKIIKNNTLDIINKNNMSAFILNIC